jgi:HK97 family phage prohead protease
MSDDEYYYPRAPEVERLFTTSWPNIKPVEVRSAPAGKPSRTVGGYAAVFGVRSQQMQGFREVVTNSFFNKSRGDGWPGVVCRFEHNRLMLLGTSAAGTLRLNTDGVGLDYTVDLPESRSDIYESIQRKDIVSSSFAFQCYEDGWDYENGYPTRQLISGRLIDVAPTATPAYLDTTVAQRSLAAHVDAPLDDVIACDGDYSKFFKRTDNIRSAPTPLDVAQRSHHDGALEIARRRSELRKKRIDWDTPPPSELDTRRARNAMWAHKIRIDNDELREKGLLPSAPVESRSRNFAETDPRCNP